MFERILDYSGKVVLVTGGRTGIGRAAAIGFAEYGAKVVIAGRTHAEETLDMIKKAGGEAIFVSGDIAVTADVERIVNTVVEKYGRLDVAFNNAGLSSYKALLHEQPEDNFDRIIAADLKGTFLCMKYEIPVMLKQGGGAIINCGSVVSLVADPTMSPYVAAKHGAAGLTKAAAIEYAKNNIRINLIAPGFTATEMTQGWLNDPVKYELVKSFNAAGREAQPEEVACMALFLGSPMATFITGAIISIDGGQTAH